MANFPCHESVYVKEKHAKVSHYVRLCNARGSYDVFPWHCIVLCAALRRNATTTSRNYISFKSSSVPYETEATNI